MAEAGLHVAVRHDGRGLDVALDAAPGEVVAVVGPNGAGKSTLLSAVAGVLRPDAGRVVLGGRTLVDTAADRWLPVHRRGVVLLAQAPLLFPHLSLARNTAYGARSAGATRSAARADAARWLAECGVDHLADRRPHQVSGGQAQRAALARALAARPRALLLDEPLAALDVTAAPQVRSLLRRVLRGDLRADVPVLLVTHDPLDVHALADRVVVVDGGRVAQHGPVADVLTRPRCAFAAQLAGRVLLSGTATATGLDLPGGGGVEGAAEPDCPPGTPALATVRPDAVRVLAGGRGARVVEVVSRGDVVRVLLALDAAPGTAPLAADLPVAEAAALDLLPGVAVGWSVDPAGVRVHRAG